MTIPLHFFSRSRVKGNRALLFVDSKTGGSEFYGTVDSRDVDAVVKARDPECSKSRILPSCDLPSIYRVLKNLIRPWICPDHILWCVCFCILIGRECNRGWWIDDDGKWGQTALALEEALSPSIHPSFLPL
jgi:hypothetical protein